MEKYRIDYSTGQIFELTADRSWAAARATDRNSAEAAAAWDSAAAAAWDSAAAAAWSEQIGATRVEEILEKIEALPGDK